MIRKIARRIGEVSVGLALGGGSALGLAHIGVLKVLEEENIPIDIVAGSSMGAFIGALWVSGIPARELEKIALEFQNKFRLFKLFDFTFPRLGLIKGKRIVKFLKKYLGDKTFEDLKIPFKITACDLESRQEIVFEEGSLVEAVRASISIPGVFVPFRKKDKFIMDGGIMEPVPVKLLMRAGVDKIIAVNTLPTQLDIERGYQDYQERLKKEEERVKNNIFRKISLKIKRKIRRLFFPNIFDAIVIGMQAMEYILAETSCQQADICLHPQVWGVSWFEFFKAKELIKKGEEEARKNIEKIKRLVKILS